MPVSLLRGEGSFSSKAGSKEGGGGVNLMMCT